MLAQWRRDARERLPELRELVRSRHELMGELAHESVPDLKEAEGGLRDATVLKALVATWLVDVPHVELERSRHGAARRPRPACTTLAGRATDRVAPELWTSSAAARLAAGDGDARAAQVHVRELGRRITHLSRLTWRRVDDVLARPARGRRTPALARRRSRQGVALAGGEVVLDRRRPPGRGPGAAAARRRRGRRARRRAGPADRGPAGPRVPRRCPTPGRPRRARAAGPAARRRARACSASGRRSRRPGRSTQILPEWERIRLLPHASAIHRFTVDRHVVETCIEASALIRQVARPDVLMVAALLHDIGKGSLTEHSVAGEPIAREHRDPDGLRRARTRDLIALLVRWHLLLAETATTRDPDDPATVEAGRRTARLGARRSSCCAR